MLLGWLQEMLLALGPVEHLLVVALALLALGYLVWYSFAHLTRYRLMEDTPTSKIQTAAQGFVELEGRVASTGPVPMLSPLRRLPCVWWSYRVESLEPALDVASAGGAWGMLVGFGLFLLHMFEVRRPKTKVWTIGSCRYEESVICVDDPIYALGLFRTHREHLDRTEWQEVAELIGDWKKDQKRLAARFDMNRDGKIDSWEWEAARLAAQDEVRQRKLQRGAGPEMHVLCRPSDKRPFMLSLLRQEGLIAHHWFRSALSIVGSLVVGILILWSFTVRPPW